MLGLTALDLGRLRISIGYGTHKKGRPLSPIEVGQLFRRACEAGDSLQDCASNSHLVGTTQVSRFLRILNLPQDLQHLISWGDSKDTIGFSCAFELARIKSADDQRVVAKSILTDGLKSKEVRQIAQLRERSGQSIYACLKEILGMRTKIERRYIFIGSVTDQYTESSLQELTQAQRDSVLKIAIDGLNFQGVTGRLGSRIFTLVGGERFNAEMNNIGKENLEAQIRTQVEQEIKK